MTVSFQHIASTTQYYCRKLVAARANEVISGGDKYYTDLVKKLNTGEVGKYIKEYPDYFEGTVSQFISKKQAILEKKLDTRPLSYDPKKRLQIFQQIANDIPETKGMQSLVNIYKYFAEKTRPEMFY